MTSWLVDLPTEAGPPWLRMGTRGLDEARWLDIDADRDRELALKRDLIAERPEEVFAIMANAGGVGLADIEAAGREVLELIEHWLVRFAPELPPTPPATERHPLEAAALLVQEDLCLVDRDLRLVAGSVCFPSHWRLPEKIGLPLAAVHAPVDHYPEDLESKVDTFMARLRAGRIVVRRNVSVHDHPDLFAPGPSEVYPTPPAGPDGPDGLWLRSERQTLRRLPDSGMVLFTIRTQVCPMRELADHPEVAGRLAVRFEALVAHQRAPGRSAHIPPALPAWLRSVSGVD